MLKITPIPALSDNYIWLLEKDQEALVIDPGQAQPVRDFLAKKGLKLTACLLTHNHDDHTAGVQTLLEEYPHLPVFGPAETAAFANQIVEPQECFERWGLTFEVLASGGHTAGHISYLLDKTYLFCGDALFSGGCGRVFTGDYKAQFEALERFKQLPDWVQVFPAHEYTQSNLKFAQAVLPPSCTLAEYQEQVDIWRAQGRPSLPTTIGLEKQINPFLRAENLADFIRLRQQKDNF
ncbi:hydroxyacylglutathione hydrolase [Pasteurellaceae bacterium RH1A]|nr:hydroxyacylglutathione hydrolase [Pasteurellaceae bacterium RH1A]